jgi:hypothetical protein
MGYEPFNSDLDQTHFQGSIMSVDTSGGHPAMDYAEHERTYRGFVRGAVTGVILLVLLLAFMAAFLV